MANFFDQFDAQPVTAGEPVPAQTPAAGPEQAPNYFDQFDGHAPAPPETWMDYGEGIARSAAQGTTLGFADEIAAGAGSLLGLGPRLLGTKTYDEILADIREHDKQFREAHPYVATGAEIAGGLGTMAFPARAVVAAPTFAARVGRSMATGAGIGAASGFGNAEGGFAERAEEGAKSGLTGAIAGPVISEVIAPAAIRTAVGLRQGARYARGALRSAQEPEEAAIQNLADRGVQSGVDWNAIRSAVLSDHQGKPLLSNQLVARNMTENDLADIVSRRMRNEPAADIGADHGIHEKTVDRYFKLYQDANPTPMNVMDLAKEVVGEGGAMPVMRLGRAAYSLAGDESNVAAQRLLDRQEVQAGRANNIISRAVTNGGDFEATRTAGITNFENEMGQRYRAFHAEPDIATDQLGDLMQDPLFRRATAQAQRQDRVAVIRRNQQIERDNATARANGQPVQPLEPVPYEGPNDPEIINLRRQVDETKDALRDARRRHQDSQSPADRRAIREEIRDHEDALTVMNRDIAERSRAPQEVISPRMLDNIQRQLRITADGHASDPNAAQHARDLRAVLLDRIEDHYPSFRPLRRDYAEGMGQFGPEGALEAGANLTTRLGAKSREALRDFATMTPAQQELYRLGFARKLMDMAANPQIGGAVANQFRTTAVREIVEELFPQSNANLWAQGQRLLRDLRREASTTGTKNFVMGGSQTAEKSSDMGRLMEGAQAAADVATGRWGKLLENVATRLSTQLGRRGAAEVVNLMTMTEPAQLLPLLNRLAIAARTTQERQAYVVAIRGIRSGAMPAVSGATGMAVADYRRNQRQLPPPR